LADQTISYSTLYKSPTNTPPTETDVVIDGTPYAMTSTGGNNYKKGVTYVYKTNTLAIGEHHHGFRFDDGSGVAINDGSDIPLITPITLTQSSVNPTSGNSSTPFTFSTTYTNVEGNAPTSLLLNVDSTSYPMSCIS